MSKQESLFIRSSAEVAIACNTRLFGEQVLGIILSGDDLASKSKRLGYVVRDIITKTALRGEAERAEEDSVLDWNDTV